ncbi:helix-turn-helix domain-containing protein [Kineosporia sp. J2-2]|uniref:Helix-turn-helix domain-containing protein n=1 Tax=Kineosporia corallincola TaxID=2835133 RepID=A0ABS5TF39_9ACTN|nr:helix-turn-helix domain-containing protein [Kineosporia corallincola]MBT0769034.1 helix-turn-helix domain-containing protein [Kineosporia corallincola]
MRIAIHAFDGITMFHLAAPQLVFGEVSKLGLGEWSTALWTTGGPSIVTAEGYPISGLNGPEVVEGADLLVVPSWRESLEPAGDELTGVIRRAHAGGTGVIGLCLGAFPVAEAGLLDGRSAVTHWSATDTLTARHPEITVDSSVLYIDHGDVLTSAGTASGIDACLHVVRRFLGVTSANRVARSLVVAPHREGGQAQYIERPVVNADADEPIAAVLAWALTRLDQPLTLEDLATRATMSRRNFVRRFREATGTTPARWVLDRRLDEARGLLETTAWGIDRIALSCGFGSAVTLRQNFAARFATSPAAYRRTFRARDAGHVTTTFPPAVRPASGR